MDGCVYFFGASPKWQGFPFWFPKKRHPNMATEPQEKDTGCQQLWDGNFVSARELRSPVVYPAEGVVFCKRGKVFVWDPVVNFLCKSKDALFGFLPRISNWDALLKVLVSLAGYKLRSGPEQLCKRSWDRQATTSHSFCSHPRLSFRMSSAWVFPNSHQSHARASAWVPRR